MLTDSLIQEENTNEDEILDTGKTGCNVNNQWIIDRVDGTSKIEPEKRPCCRACFVPPCVKLVPGFFEQNICCESWGKFGFIDSTDMKARLWLMRISLLSNCISLLLSIIACFAISTNYNILMNISFSKGIFTPIDSTYLDDITINVGLLAVAIDNPNTEGKGTVNGFDELCDDDVAGAFFDQSSCHDCSDISSTLVTTLILSAITVLPSIFTDILRMYPNYDANCQKTIGTLAAFFSVLNSIATWQLYAVECVRSFVESENLSWYAGEGLKLIVAATFIRIVPIVCHLIVPTPSITRDYKEQEEYERLSKVTSHDPEFECT
mmetsp:Transcript_32814/g.37978  ORF Transcript_32814/g.37978 Transcript_32814/m.37978 type:complete len:322 (-) Transcript_32814:652-1617(-)|eukprot:CAMPEP_0194410250 /NCGR_PEP_ID=MMETSP0176-20130528/8275_1 /TAXON_ID=216777 /ORGANISM="Proboscia alata, Strain PI-D3" /LENGTH=321 /DNA_ID=CAMNT_0039211459 /DNA_START=57 /DNA_END=1022 /DNA_ORIENTATION=-